jgi:hypothetical protein
MSKTEPTTSSRAVPTRLTTPEPEPAKAPLTGTWWFDNPAGDEEQMAIDHEGNVVVLYSNGHRDTTAIRDGTITLAEYGGAKVRMWLEDGAILQEFASADTGQKCLKRWSLIDTQPRYEPVRPLSGEQPSKSIQIEARLLMVKRGFLGGLGLSETIPPRDGSTVDAIVGTGGDDKHPTTFTVYKAMCKIIDDDMLNRILKTTKQHADAKLLTSPKVMVLSGQEAVIAIGQVNPVKSDNVRNLIPGGRAQQMQEGFQLSMTPKETGPDQAILLWFQADLVGMNLKLDRPGGDIDRIQINSEVTIPQGKALLVHGLYSAVKDTTDIPSQIVLLIRPEIVPVTTSDQYIENPLKSTAPSSDAEGAVLEPAITPSTTVTVPVNPPATPVPTP